MPSKTQNVIFVLIAALISMSVHVAMIAVAGRIPFGEWPGLSPEPLQAPRRITVQTIDVRQRVLGRQQIETVRLTRDAAEAVAESLVKEQRLQDIFAEQQLLPEPQPKFELKGLGENIILPELARLDPAAPPVTPRPEIVEIDADALDPESIAIDRLVTARLPRVPTGSDNLPSFVVDDEARAGSAGVVAAGMRMSLPASLPDMGKMVTAAGDDPGNSQDLTPDRAHPGLPETTSPAYPKENRPHNIDAMLNVQMVVHRPAVGDGYFRIDISPNPRSDQLRAIPKDVLFLIDRSNSISPAKLSVFKEAALHAIEYLNPLDRFNVVSFRAAPDSLFDDYVAASSDNLERARKYIRRLFRGGLTDVYAALAPYVAEDTDNPLRPLTVFIFTDGLSTVDDKLDNNTFLQRIVEINRQQVSIYSASCGSEANRFLLDLLAYSNRGVPLHEPELDQFESKIADFIRTHSDIIAANLDYRITGGLDNEIYPRKFPQLYRGETLSVYGRFPAKADSLAIQITGRSADGSLQEFIFRGNPRTAPEVGPELAYDWIAQKVFDLIVQNTLEPSPEKAEELQRLVRKHNLQVPYF
jgi:hypothetical protein